MEKLRLSISIHFPAFILFSIILLTTSLYIFFTATLLLAIHINFISFKKAKIVESSKMIFFIFVYLILSSAAFSTLPIDIQFNNSKIGLFVGFTISIFFCNFIINNSNLRQNRFGFINSENTFNVVELSFVFLLVTILLLLIYILLLTFFGGNIANIKDFLLLFFILFSLWLHGNFYSIWNGFFTKYRLNHKIGISIVFTAIIIFFWTNSGGVYEFLALFLFLIGMFLIQHSSIDSKSDLRNDFNQRFILPSILVSMFICIFFFFLNDNFETNFSVWLMPPNEASLHINLALYEADLSKRINNDFEELKKQRKIDPNAEPIVKFRVTENKSLWLRNEINLEGTFTYNYEKPLNISIKNYAEGEYLLENSSISKIIVNAFDFSIQHYLSRYLEEGRNVNINILGTADAIPFSEERKTKYIDAFGLEINKQVINEATNKKEDIHIVSGTELNNNTLAFLRCYGVEQYIKKYISKLNLSNTKYINRIYYDQNNIGGKFRKSEIKIEIFDILISAKK